MGEQQTVTVIPPEPGETGVSRSQGTRVVLADGTELGKVTKITLVAEINEVWRGTIELMPAMGVMKGMEVSINRPNPSWWRTMLCRMAGVVVSETAIDAHSNRWRTS